MTQTCEAIFENGTFRPINLPKSIAEGQHVRLIVEATAEATGPEDILERHEPGDGSFARLVRRETAMGKYTFISGSSEDFARDKQQEIAREERLQD